MVKITEEVDFGVVEDAELGQQVYQVSVQWSMGVVSNVMDSRNGNTSVSP